MPNYYRSPDLFQFLKSEIYVSQNPTKDQQFNIFKHTHTKKKKEKEEDEKAIPSE